MMWLGQFLSGFLLALQGEIPLHTRPPASYSMMSQPVLLHPGFMFPSWGNPGSLPLYGTRAVGPSSSPGKHR